MAKGYTYVVCTDHGLEVNLWIPVRIINDDHISCGQVDAQATSPSAEHEDELAAVWFIEVID